jgi:hypothetical protein
MKNVTTSTDIITTFITCAHNGVQFNVAPIFQRWAVAL